ncbi:MAG: hypothetical protein J5I90_06285 [Caldilineales bacterium]|nr:hypothetical protein [Caldilineales bacterium]
MQITVRLTEEIREAYPFGAIGLGTPLEFVVVSNVLFGAEYDDPPGWCVPSTSTQAKSFTPICHHLYAFSGQISDVLVEDEEDDRYYHALVDCQVPISLFGAQAFDGGASGKQAIPRRGQFLVGFAYMNLDWADDVTVPLTKPLAGTVVAIDRLILRPGPGFGQNRSESEVLPVPLGPDQIFLTIDVHS